MKLKRNIKLLFLCLLLLSVSGITIAQNGPKLIDTEVASVAVVANQIDIDYAKIAIKRSKNKDITEFATRMIEDHNAVISQAVALVEKLGVNPKDNAVSQSLLDQAETKLKILRTVKKKDFDKTYIDNEVEYHRAVIDAVKGLLIPETENEELKALLEAVLPALEAHLNHAKMVQSKI